MLKLKLLLISLLLCNAVFAADMQNSSSESSMMLPKPIENKVYDSMIGTWEGDTNMMGRKMHEVLKVRWGLNHQFIILELKTTIKDKSKMTYEGLGVWGIDNKGDPKTFWFDSWGADAMSSGYGRFSDNELEIHYSNPVFKETRIFKLEGKKIVTHARGIIMAGEKEKPFSSTTIYRKK